MSIFSKNHLKSETIEKNWIVYLTTFPPRECGLATFSEDLINYTDELFFKGLETKVIAINNARTAKLRYPSKVLFGILENSKEEFIAAAEKLNAMPEVKIVSIQHEFGLFGKNFGENIIFFLDTIKKPVSVTFHTVLSEPSEEMKFVMQKICIKAERMVVMTELSKKILIDVYATDPEKTKVIPHGIHPQLYSDTKEAKKKLGLESRIVLTTFGLLSSGKGVEYALMALPAIIEKYPNVVYLVVGETHPVVMENEGEVYRNKLINLVASLGIENNVVFVNRYLSNDELLLYLQASDIYLSLSQDPNQTVSGTLTYALGTGRAVISTAFMQAKEIITPHTGVLINFKDSESVAREVLGLLNNPERLQSLGKTAYFATRYMTWPNVALSYMSMFSHLAPALSEKNKNLLPIKIDHLKKLTDDFGVFQFASLHNPDPDWGYTLDDNARALIVLCWYNALLPSADKEELINIYLQFIERASHDAAGFVDHYDKEKNPHNELKANGNSEDTNARAVWALAVAQNKNSNPDFKIRANKLLKDKFALHQKVTSPRAAALYIKAMAEYITSDEDKEMPTEHIKFYADFLVDLFQRTKEGEWQWFEESLTYSNALLCEALLIAYAVTENPIYFEIGKITLDFLLQHSFEGDVCVPVGQAGWYKKGGKKEIYDQQPEEVSALVLALHRMVLLKDDPTYQEKMILAFDWFLGNNLSRQIVYTHSTGGSYDGIREGGVNLNQGSESTISYLLARLALEIS